MLAIVAPGQGAQKPGMLTAWLELDGVPATLAAMSERAKLDLVRLGTTAGADEIKDTAVTQPLVVAAALLGAGQFDLPSGSVIAGHSVGELAAAALAGVLPELDAVELAAVRGTAMSAACALTPTGMSAVMGGETEDVLAALAELDLVGANVNGGGQIVAAGPIPALEKLAANPPDGTRIIPLPVAGAFHTSYMASAQSALESHLGGVRATDPLRPLLSNSDGSVVATGSAYLGLLVAQVTKPVRWDLCMQTLQTLGVTGVLELPPAGTLVGLIRRDLKGVATMALKSPAELDKAADFVAEHSGVRL
jgi:[acyl-carrier-protein] S-malonyltransferase